MVALVCPIPTARATMSTKGVGWRAILSKTAKRLSDGNRWQSNLTVFLLTIPGIWRIGMSVGQEADCNRVCGFNMNHRAFWMNAEISKTLNSIGCLTSAPVGRFEGFS
jgi:hypothetical protein